MTQTIENATITVATTAALCPKCGSANFIVEEEGHQWVWEGEVEDDYHTHEHCLDCGYEHLDEQEIDF